MTLEATGVSSGFEGSQPIDYSVNKDTTLEQNNNSDENHVMANEENVRPSTSKGYGMDDSDDMKDLRQSSNSPLSDNEASNGEVKDEAYWEKRRKNNEAAKRSRDSRRAKEDEIAIRAAFLERENFQLKWELARLKTETEKLKDCLVNESAFASHVQYN